MLSKYLYISYESVGRGATSGDCLNLLHQFYKNEFGIHLHDAVDYKDGWEKDRDLFHEFAEQVGFYEVDDQTFGDVVLFSLRGRTCHCGVIVSEDTVIHTTKLGTTISNMYSMDYRLKVVGIFRYRRTLCCLNSTTTS